VIGVEERLVSYFHTMDLLTDRDVAYRENTGNGLSGFVVCKLVDNQCPIAAGIAVSKTTVHPAGGISWMSRCGGRPDESL
jgi:hypothetical protein